MKSLGLGEMRKLSTEFIKEAKNDENKMEEVIRNYYPMVCKIVGGMDTRMLPGVDYSDLISIGLDSIYKAVNRYDNKAGASFDTYCYTCIKGYILQEIRKFSSAKHGDLNHIHVSIEKMIENGYSFANMIVDETDYEQLALNGNPTPENGWKLVEQNLNKTQIDLVQKFYVEGVGSAELGQMYGLSQQAILARLKTIRKQLAKKLTKEQLYIAFGLPMSEKI